MADEDKTPDIDKKDLKEKVEKDTKSRKWNNANSRRNLKQYQTPIVPEIVGESLEDMEADVSAQCDCAGF